VPYRELLDVSTDTTGNRILYADLGPPQELSRGVWIEESGSVDLDDARQKDVRRTARPRVGCGVDDAARGRYDDKTARPVGGDLDIDDAQGLVVCFSNRRDLIIGDAHRVRAAVREESHSAQGQDGIAGWMRTHQAAI